MLASEASSDSLICGIWFKKMTAQKGIEPYKSIEGHRRGSVRFTEPSYWSVSKNCEWDKSVFGIPCITPMFKNEWNQRRASQTVGNA